MSVIDGMQSYMDGPRAYWERARAVRRFAERVSPARFGGRVARVLVGGPEDLAAYHADLLRAERRR